MPKACSVIPSAIVLGFTAVSALAQQASTTLVSSGLSGAATLEGASDLAISASGRYVAFVSASSALVANDANAAPDVFVRDRRAGTTVRASVDSAGNETHPDPGALFDGPLIASPALSDDGRFVAFTSLAPDLVPNDTNAVADVFVRDLVLGTTERVSLAAAGVEGDQHSGMATYQVCAPGSTCWTAHVASGVAISADGRFVAFASMASNLVANDTNGLQDVFVHDRASGACELVSVAATGAANSTSWFPSLSADASRVAFESFATNLVALDTNVRADVFVRDRSAGTTTRASVSSTGVQGNQQSGLYFYDPPPAACAHCAGPRLVRLGSAIAADGRSVAFGTESSNLTPGDFTYSSDVFLRELESGVTRLVSADLGGHAGGTSLLPSVSADGRFVAFLSTANDLVPSDTNPWNHDVFVRDLALETTQLVGLAADGSHPAHASRGVALAADGAQLAFSSTGQLAPSDTNLAVDVYARGAPLLAIERFCEGSPAACPCANSGGAGSGCSNSASANGARLDGTGVASLTSDTLVLDVRGVPAATVVVFVQGSAGVPTSSATAFGDGVGCLAGTLVRLAARTAHFGAAALGVAGDPRISVLGAVGAAGTQSHYQAVYRDLAPFCTPAAFNASSSLRVTWDQ